MYWMESYNQRILYITAILMPLSYNNSIAACNPPTHLRQRSLFTIGNRADTCNSKSTDLMFTISWQQAPHVGITLFIPKELRRLLTPHDQAVLNVDLQTNPNRFWNRYILYVCTTYGICISDNKVYITSLITCSKYYRTQVVGIQHQQRSYAMYKFELHHFTVATTASHQTCQVRSSAVRSIYMPRAHRSVVGSQCVSIVPLFARQPALFLRRSTYNERFNISRNGSTTRLVSVCF